MKLSDMTFNLYWNTLMFANHHSCVIPVKGTGQAYEGKILMSLLITSSGLNTSRSCLLEGLQNNKPRQNHVYF